LGLSRAADKDILCRAGTDYRVVITLDADFHALLALGEQTGPSTVRIRIEGLHGKAVADLLVAIWPTIEIPVREGALITVTENAVRIRRLPIASRR
jgi:predicted nuclease of predicted toxin-antitoxin system